MGRKAVPRLREQLDPSGSTAECDKTNGQPVMECAVCGMRFRNGRLILPQNVEEPTP